MTDLTPELLAQLERDIADGEDYPLPLRSVTVRALVAAAKERDQLRSTLQMVEPERDALRAELDRRDVSYTELCQLRAKVAKHGDQIAAISDWLALGAAARDERDVLAAHVRALLAAHVRALLQVIDRKSYSSAAQQEAVRAAEAAIGGVP